MANIPETAIAPEIYHRSIMVREYEWFIRISAKVQNKLSVGTKVPKDLITAWVAQYWTVYNNITPYIQKFGTLYKQLQQTSEKILMGQLDQKVILEAIEQLKKAYYISGIIKIDQAQQNQPLPLDAVIFDFLKDNLGIDVKKEVEL